MNKIKMQIFIALLFLIVGIAAVTTNLIINGNTSIASNQDDFLVYFSNVLVNGTQDLSLVNNEKELVFNRIFSAIGDKVTIEYDVTNASKNYDATISISCTESNNYLNVTNNFDQKSNLLARSTRTGTLTVELTNAVSTEQSYEVKCTITGTAVERNTQNIGEIPSPVETQSIIGNEITIANEKFNVISDNGETITMLARYNIDYEFRQNEEEVDVIFSENIGWEYTPGPKEIDIFEWSTEPENLIINYINYLKTETGDQTITGDLISLNQLKQLDCEIPASYDAFTTVNYDQRTCMNSKYKNWLVNGQYWWTKSAESKYNMYVWIMFANGNLTANDFDFENAVRPVITISKDTHSSLTN